jgi:Rrf2 family protein
MLSQKAKYALQALSYLSEQYSTGALLLIHQIADEKKIPTKFLEAILLELKKADILVSFRGRTGGYKLKDPPQKTSVAKVIRIIDGPIAMLNCVSLNFYKPCENCDGKSCGINPVFAEARDAILKVLEKRSLKDIVRNTRFM